MYYIAITNTTGEGRGILLLASSGQKPEILPNALCCTFPQTKNYPAKNIDCAKIKKSCPILCFQNLHELSYRQAFFIPEDLIPSVWYLIERLMSVAQVLTLKDNIQILSVPNQNVCKSLVSERQRGLHQIRQTDEQSLEFDLGDFKNENQVSVS